MSIERIFSRRQVLRYGIAAVATAGSGVAFAQPPSSPHDPIPPPPPKDVLTWATEQAKKGAKGIDDPNMEIEKYFTRTFEGAFEKRLKDYPLYLSDLVVLGGLCHQWGLLCKTISQSAGATQIRSSYCSAATDTMQNSDEFNHLCEESDPGLFGRWCEEVKPLAPK